MSLEQLLFNAVNIPAGEDLVPKPTRKSETFTRSRNRKVTIVSATFTASFLRPFRGRRGASPLRGNGSCDEATIELPRRPSESPTCN